MSTRLVCDNLKPAVTRWIEGEPELNRAFAAFARHYGIAVCPARPRSPRDKGAVENAVRTVQSRILVRLRGVPFFTLTQMNDALRCGIDELNAAEMKAVGTSRQAQFATSDRPALTALPQTPWVWYEHTSRTVAKNYHVTLDYCHYSAPSHLIGRAVDVAYTDTIVEVRLPETGEVVARHCRRMGRNLYATKPEHMPENHREMALRQRNDYGDWLMEEMEKIGPIAVVWAERNIASRDFEVHAWRSLRGVIQLLESHGPARVEDACRAALAEERFTSGFIRAWLQTPAPVREPEGEEVLPAHENIRGSAYYRGVS